MQMKKIYGWDYYCERILRKSQLFIENSLAEKENSYIVFDIRDRGKERTICQVDKTSGLYQLQNNLNRNLLAKIPLSKQRQALSGAELPGLPETSLRKEVPYCAWIYTIF